jgi:hypothetical protein
VYIVAFCLVGLRFLVVLFSDHRKEKSLGLLTQNFVKLFLTMEVGNSVLFHCFCLRIHGFWILVALLIDWYDICTSSRLT